MTDRYAIQEYQRLFADHAQSNLESQILTREITKITA